MKLLHFVLVVSLISLLSCFQEVDVVESAASLEARLSNYGENFIPLGLFLSSHAAVSIHDDIMTLSLDEGYDFIALMDDGTEVQARSSASGGGVVALTCSCTQGGGGCSPIKAQGREGCLIESPCTSCDKALIGVPGDILGMAVINLEADFFVEDFSDIEGLQFLPPALLDHSLVQEYVNDITNLAWNGYSEDVITKDVLVNIYGNLAVITIPVDSDDQGLIVTGGGVDGGFSCACNTDGSCKEENKMGIKFCNAAKCKSCTMNLIVSDPDGDVSMSLSVDHLGRW